LENKCSQLHEFHSFVSHLLWTCLKLIKNKECNFMRIFIWKSHVYSRMISNKDSSNSYFLSISSCLKSIERKNKWAIHMLTSYFDSKYKLCQQNSFISITSMNIYSLFNIFRMKTTLQFLNESWGLNKQREKTPEKCRIEE